MDMGQQKIGATLASHTHDLPPISSRRRLARCAAAEWHDTEPWQASKLSGLQCPVAKRRQRTNADWLKKAVSADARLLGLMTQAQAQIIAFCLQVCGECLSASLALKAEYLSSEELGRDCTQIAMATSFIDEVTKLWRVRKTAP